MTYFMAFIFLSLSFLPMSVLRASDDPLKSSGFSLCVAHEKNQSLRIQLKKDGISLFDKNVDLNKDLRMMCSLLEGHLTLDKISSKKCELYYTNDKGRSLLCHLNKNGHVTVLESTRGDDLNTLGLHASHSLTNKATIVEKGFSLSSPCFWNKGFIGSQDYHLSFKSALNTGIIHGGYKGNYSFPGDYVTRYKEFIQRYDYKAPKKFQFFEKRFQNAGILISEGATILSSTQYEDHGLSLFETLHGQKGSSFEAHSGNSAYIYHLKGEFDNITFHDDAAFYAENFDPNLTLKSICPSKNMNSFPDQKTDINHEDVSVDPCFRMRSSTNPAIQVVPVGRHYTCTLYTYYRNGIVVGKHQTPWVYSHTVYTTVLIHPPRSVTLRGMIGTNLRSWNTHTRDLIKNADVPDPSAESLKKMSQEVLQKDLKDVKLHNISKGGELRTIHKVSQPSKTMTGGPSGGDRPPQDPGFFKRLKRITENLKKTLQDKNIFESKRTRLLDIIAQVFLTSGVDLEDLNYLFSGEWGEFRKNFFGDSFMDIFTKDRNPLNEASLLSLPPNPWLQHAIRIIVQETKGENLGTWLKSNPDRAADLLISAFSFRKHTNELLNKTFSRLSQKVREGKNRLPIKTISRSHKDFGKHFQSHHVISDKYPGTKKHDLWKLSDRSPNDPFNKILLPTKKGSKMGKNKRSIHYGRHLKSVNDNMKKKMDFAVIEGELGGWSQNQYAEALKRIINEEKEVLKSGTRILNKHHRPWGIQD